MSYNRLEEPAQRARQLRETIAGEGAEEGVVGEQARNALATIDKALKQAGSSIEDTVRVTYYVGDVSYVDEVVDAVGAVFKDIRPAASMLIVKMIEEAMKIEIEVTARIGAANS